MDILIQPSLFFAQTPAAVKTPNDWLPEIPGLQGLLFSLCVLGVFLLAGKLLRVKIKLFQKLFLPSSIIAGFVALALGPFGFKLIPSWIMNDWSGLPGALINVVFASLFLGVALPRMKTLWEYGGPQLCYGVVVGMGQYFIALLVTLLLIIPFFDIGSPIFVGEEINNLNKLAVDLNSHSTTAKARIWDKLDDNARKSVESIASGKVSDNEKKALISGLNVLLKDRSLYDKTAFQDVKLVGKGAKLAGKDTGSLSEKQLMEMNRAVIQSTFPVDIDRAFRKASIFACIVEIGFSGGHGTAAGMKDVFTNLGMPEGGDLSLMSATVGIICAVVFGIVLINIAIRSGYCACLNEKEGIPTYKKTGLIPEPKRYSIATATVATEAIEPLTFHFGIVAISILIGWIMLGRVQSIHPDLKSFPLFPLAMLGGLIVQWVSSKLKIDQYYDRDTFDRILGFSLDVLVISAIAVIKLDMVMKNIWPFTILMTTGLIWVIFCTVVIAPRMFPRYWFERGITEYGMQTGVTAIGLLLLRVVDPLYKTGTATAFGFKQMIYEPFLGGGFITAMAPILVIKYGPLNAVLFSLVIMVTFILISFFNGWINMKPSLQFKE